MKRYQSLFEYQTSAVTDTNSSAAHTTVATKNKSDFFLAPTDSEKSEHTEPDWEILDLSGAEWADDQSVISEMMNRGMLQGKSPDEVSIQRKGKTQLYVLDNESEEVVAKVRLASKY